MARKLDLIGKKFGRWTVFGKASQGTQSGSYWMCECACGVETVHRTGTLTGGKSESCGCLKSEVASERWAGKPPGLLPSDQAFINRIHYKYKYGAKDRGISWDLSTEQVATLVKQNCDYCNRSPAQKLEIRRSFNGVFLCNGIDRVDNTLGYMIANCVPCCKTCNTMKLALGQKEFLEHIARIYDHKLLVLMK